MRGISKRKLFAALSVHRLSRFCFPTYGFTCGSTNAHQWSKLYRLLGSFPSPFSLSLSLSPFSSLNFSFSLDFLPNCINLIQSSHRACINPCMPATYPPTPSTPAPHPSSMNLTLPSSLAFGASFFLFGTLNNVLYVVNHSLSPVAEDIKG